jgi:hypothetical protein
VLGSLALFCAARPLLERAPTARLRPAPLVAGGAVLAGVLVAAGIPARPAAATAAPLVDTAHLPAVTILHSTGVSTQLNRPTALRIASDLVADLAIAADALQSRSASWAAAGAAGAWLDQLRQQIRCSDAGVVVPPTASST